MRVYGVVGWKDMGKTTLVERLIAEIAGRGVTVSTIKHTHHGVDVDRPGKDSHRHRAAGAGQVILASSARWALMTELRGAPEATLDELVTRLDPVDLVLVEGYKRDSHRKIEVWRAARGLDPIASSDPTVRAIATADAPPAGFGRPVLPLDDARAIADFLLVDCGLGTARGAAE
ncbi:MAG: molybdopterin-guanine dinucleotide biosynthesis protein B [Paracoccaceae bacterium]